MAGELIAPGLHQRFRADDTFGSFVEAWLVQLRRAQESPTARTTGIQRRCVLRHYFMTLLRPRSRADNSMIS